MMMGKKARRKGLGYENHIAHQFQHIGWEDAKRHLELQSTEAEEGRDLDNTQPFGVQCKCYKSTPSIMAIQQLKETEDYPLRVAILKRTRSKNTSSLEVAVLDINVFFDILDLLTDEQFEILVDRNDIRQ